MAARYPAIGGPSTKGTVKNVVALWTSNLKAVAVLYDPSVTVADYALGADPIFYGEADIDISAEAGKTATLSLRMSTQPRCSVYNIMNTI
jgi:hypothetical protein